MKFIDEAEITVTSGNGGPGCISFRREDMVPRGGPDGGDGGRGGDVILIADSQITSLLDLKFKKKYVAGNGLPGTSSLCSGKDGADVVIKVPKGSVIKTASGRVLVDMSEQDEFVVARGGLGGKGNYFYRSSIQQAPEKAQKGLPGESFELHLELKILADVGIIGFPNAGKSTLISRISAAKPKIADYPFTTLVPNLGVVRVDEERSFVVADIPGLIEGAHLGVGLGHKFLRHIERTKLFVHVVDVSGMSGREPLEDYENINKELKAYDADQFGEEAYLPLSERLQIVVLNKVDALTDSEKLKIEQDFLNKGIDVLLLSAVAGYNVRALIERVAKLIFRKEES